MTTTPPAAARRAHRESAPARILDAADSAFAEQGYDGTSLARVAEAVGMSQAGLLHHFPTKRALLLAVLERRDAVDSDRTGLPGRVEGLAALDALVALMRHNAARRGLVQSFAVLSGESAAEHHAARGYFTRRYARLRRELGDALRAGVRSGQVRADADCTAIAAEVFAIMDGLQLQWLHDPDQVDMVALFERYVDRLRGELTARTGLPRDVTLDDVDRGAAARS